MGQMYGDRIWETSLYVAEWCPVLGPHEGTEASSPEISLTIGGHIWESGPPDLHQLPGLDHRKVTSFGKLPTQGMTDSWSSSGKRWPSLGREHSELTNDDFEVTTFGIRAPSSSVDTSSVRC